MNRLPKALLGCLSPLLALALWEAASRFRLIDPIFFPPPARIAKRLFELMTTDGLFPLHLRASFWRLAAGAALAIPAAVLGGMAIALHRGARAAFMPLVALTYPIPKLAVFPLLLIVFGAGDASKIAIIAIGIFYLVLLNTIRGVENLEEAGYFEIVQVYKLPLLTRLVRVTALGALPDILNGVKLGLGYGLVMVVAGEFTVSRLGVGVFMWNAWDQFRILDVYCGLAALSLLGIVLFYACEFLAARASSDKSFARIKP